MLDYSTRCHMVCKIPELLLKPWDSWQEMGLPWQQQDVMCYLLYWSLLKQQQRFSNGIVDLRLLL